MGFDIDISHFNISKDKAYKDWTVAETYISYNWSNLSDICLIHFLEGDGKCHEGSKCVRVHLWYFKDDCHGRRGDDVAERAQGALILLAKHGILPGTPDPENVNWGWGQRGIPGEKYSAEPLLPRERLDVFAYHIKRFLDLGERNPNCFFWGDHENSGNLILPDGTEVHLEEEEEEEEEEETVTSVILTR